LAYKNCNHTKATYNSTVNCCLPMLLLTPSSDIPHAVVFFTVHATVFTSTQDSEPTIAFCLFKILTQTSNSAVYNRLRDIVHGNAVQWCKLITSFDPMPFNPFIAHVPLAGDVSCVISQQYRQCTFSKLFTTATQNNIASVEHIYRNTQSQ